MIKIILCAIGVIVPLFGDEIESRVTDDLRKYVVPDDGKGGFVSLFPLAVEAPRSFDPSTLLGLRQYYDQVVEVSAKWKPKGVYLRLGLREYIRDLYEGDYLLTPVETMRITNAREKIYRQPTDLEQLKGISGPQLRKEVERHLAMQSVVLDNLSGKWENFDKGLIFSAYAELIANEGSISQALSAEREILELRQKTRKQEWVARFNAGSETPIFYPSAPDWTGVGSWINDIKISGGDPKSTCLLDVKIITIVRPWMPVDFYTAEWGRISAGSESDLIAKQAKEKGLSFFEHRFTAIPIALLLAGNKRLIGNWTPDSVDRLPAAIKSIQSDPILIGIIAVPSPGGPISNNRKFKFLE
ncbi:hypothetical protein [Luteolibacter soli]|uniref:DUF4424 domain-containing protein n=1 Tax=Luteolibacter soli TaxID=3135280 RepID=A0ABU9B3D7_9BACT